MKRMQTLFKSTNIVRPTAPYKTWDNSIVCLFSKENHFFHIHQIYFHFLFFQNSENKSLKNDALTKLHSSYLFPKKYMRQLKVFFLDFCGWTSVTCLARIYIFFQWHTNPTRFLSFAPRISVQILKAMLIMSHRPRYNAKG